MRAPIRFVVGAWVMLATYGTSAAAAPRELAPPSVEAMPAKGDAALDPYLTFAATSFVGDGLRFNNPYRLATPLGDDAQSISRTAVYLDLGAQALFFAPPKFQHGAALRFSVALEGIRQAVLTPSYLLQRRFRHVALHGRAGLPFVLTPQKNTGFELALGATWFVRGGLGLTGEMVGDLFYGAGTREVAKPAYPILAAQLGITVSYEVLP